METPALPGMEEGRKFLPGTRQLPTPPRPFGCCCDYPGWEMPIGPHFQPGAPGLLPGANLGARRSQGDHKAPMGTVGGG